METPRLRKVLLVESVHKIQLSQIQTRDQETAQGAFPGPSYVFGQRYLLKDVAIYISCPCFSNECFSGAE